jgi:hypothetical protein
MPINIFFSYAHADEELLSKLKAHLSPFQRQGLIDRSWYDRNISAGTEWEKEIDKHLNSANIILLLVSSDFMASDYCYSVEMKRALERHDKGEARVIPVILRRIHWQQSPIGKLQAVPTDGKPVKSWPDEDDALYDVAEGIRKAIVSLIPQRTEQISAIKSTSTNQSSLTKDEHIHQVKLVERLNDAVEALYATTRKDKHFHMGIFLHQSININADEVSLTKIIEDVVKYTDLRKSKPKEF